MRDVEFQDLRQAAAIVEPEDGALLAYARAMMTWHQRHRFCGACGAPTESQQAGHLRRCTRAECAAEIFPRTDPAVIMLVRDGDWCLLGRQARWPPGVYSALAGFVEPGESLEDAVGREVMEEAGVAIDGCEYHSSQPWPFPSSIMLGFWATARRGEVRVDGSELEEARWFHRDQVLAQEVRLPPKLSIARRLIDDWLRAERLSGWRDRGGRRACGAGSPTLLLPRAARPPRRRPPPRTWSRCRAASPPSRELVGHVDQDPERFIASLNAQLLSATRSDHDWQSIPRRRDLVRFLDLIAELERRFPGRIELGASKDGRRTVERLADSLGFEVVEDRRRGVVVVPKNEGDDDQAFRRTAAQALGFELDRVSDRLGAGESWTVTIPSDRAPSPLPPELWLRSTGRADGAGGARDAGARPTTEPRGRGLRSALPRDARATRRAWICAGCTTMRRSPSVATRRRSPSRTDAWWYPAATRRFLPGAAWSVRATTRRRVCCARLLEQDRAKGAYLWHSLRFAPPPAVDYFVGRGDGASGGLLRRVFDRLDAVHRRVRQLALHAAGVRDAGALAADRRRPAAPSPSRRARSVVDGDRGRAAAGHAGAGRRPPRGSERPTASTKRSSCCAR